MTVDHHPYNDQRMMSGPQWPPQYQPPSPFATHEHLNPLYSRIGALEQGQVSIVASYNHLRGDMLTQFAALEKLIKAQEQPPQKGVNLTFRELAIIAAALVVAGAFLGGRLGLATLMGG